MMITVEAINNLATAAESGKKTIAELTKANATLVKTNAELTKALSKLDILLSNKATTNTPTTPDDKHSNKERKFFNENYCWSHGYHVSNNHTSATCKNTKPGHKIEATRANTMGRYQSGKKLVGL